MPAIAFGLGFTTKPIRISNHVVPVNISNGMPLAKQAIPIISEKKLTAKSRNAMPDSTFAIPGERKYPINDKNHARNALSRVSQNGSSAQKAKVRKAVHNKFPGIGKG